MQITSIGIDLGKTTFHLVALDERGKVVIRQKFSRKQLLAFTANLPSSLIGIEACSGAHFMGVALREQGHDVRLIPAQFVKPFLKSNKNDFLDAEAIAEAVARQNMRFVPIKTDDQLDLQALHRVRDRLVHRRTALINQIRGFLLERGITFAKGAANLRHQMPAILEDAEPNLTPRLRSLLDHLWQEWKGLNADIECVSDEIDAIAGQDAACQRLRQIPGVGPLVATATVAAIGNGAAFRKGREFAAWLWQKYRITPERHKFRAADSAGRTGHEIRQMDCPHHRFPLRAQQGKKVRLCKRTRDQEALDQVAVEFTDDFQLRLCFDALGHRAHSQASRQRHYRRYNRARSPGFCDLLHERAIDFQGVDGKLVQVAERGVARPEIINGDLDAEHLQDLHLPRRLLDVVHDQALGKFQFNTGRIHAGRRHDLCHGIRKINAIELQR